jgi:hypothetical protein
MLARYANLPAPLQWSFATIGALGVAVRSDLGFLDYSASEFAPLLAQISGVLVAVSWPTAQLAGHSVDKASDLLSRILGQYDQAANLSWLGEQLTDLRVLLKPGRRGVWAAILSFAFALLAILMPADDVIRGALRLSLEDLFCGLSLAVLITSILNFLPIVLHAFRLDALDSALKAISALEDARRELAEASPPEPTGPQGESSSAS